tara:strand:+ start:49976 stop:50857 length:882 start_codon:yes stop_codon:yes gene_type:complete
MILVPIRPSAATVLLLAYLTVGQSASVCAEVPGLLNRLTGGGISLTDRDTVTLQSPILADAEVEQSVLDEIAGGIGWKRFSRDSIVAPIEIDMDYLKDDAGQRIGHRVYVAFVVHCDIDTLRDRDRMDELFGAVKDDPDADDYHAEEITADQLQRWDVDDEPEGMKYVAVRMPLLDRILVSGVVASQYVDTDPQLTISWMMDPRFADGKSEGPANRWQRIDGDEKKVHPYQGVGGYVQITRLSEPTPACLVESRMVIHEPPQWFSGSNLLRSKLPLMIQESVRKFRRQVSSPK